MKNKKDFFRLYRVLAFSTFVFLIGLVSISCDRDDPEDDEDPGTGQEESFNFNQYPDHYGHIASWSTRSRWGFYNVHDPAILLADDGYYYCYSTDASYGNEAPPGLQVRRSEDLLNWEWVGLAFDGLPEQGEAFIRANGGEPFDAIWAPYAYKVGDEYRLYYSLSSPTPRLSAIGLVTSSNPDGPWEEKGLVVTSLANNERQTNAIDPTVIIAQNGEHWFYYGSAWDGIYILQLDPATGLALNEGDKGRRIAQRGFTNGRINGNIEGPEIIYNPEQQKYYLFIAYDWLETKYNVRVGRSDSPDGPFYDFHGQDMNLDRDDEPMILGSYKFEGHPGYQGVSHPGVFQDEEGQFYMATQARPSDGIFFMTMHIRKMFWTKDGWPVVSPQRYGKLAQSPVAEEDLTGTWEYIEHGYDVVPGYAEEQTNPGFQIAERITLGADGTINGSQENQWSFNAPWLTLSWDNGEAVDEVYVEWGRDWENQVPKTLIFTGLNQEGTAVWGKKSE